MKAVFVLSACLLLLAGCSRSEGPLEDFAEDGITVQLVLNMPSAAADNTAAGESVGNESWISTQDVQMLVYDKDGNFADRASMSQVLPLVGVGSYRLTGTLTRLRKADVESGAEYRIVVLANMLGTLSVDYPHGGVLPDREEDLYNDRLTFGFPESNHITEEILNKDPNGRIPMWGKKTCTLQNGGEINVDMLRALAKVSVKLSEEVAKQHTLEAVSVRNCHMFGRMVPAGAADMAETPQEVDADQINVAGHYHTEVPFVESPEGSGVFYTYLPEQKAYAHSSEQGEEVGSYMEVNIYGINYRLYFADYATHTTFPIVRNRYYEFTITGINTSGELCYQVCSWDVQNAGDIEFN